MFAQENEAKQKEPFLSNWSLERGGSSAVQGLSIKYDICIRLEWTLYPQKTLISDLKSILFKSNLETSSSHKNFLNWAAYLRAGGKLICD